MTPSQRILPAEFPYERLAEELAAGGWQPEPAAGRRAPLIAGEPESASWSRDGVRLVYTFNPAVRLRVLALDVNPEKPTPEIPTARILHELDEALPVLEAGDLLRLLDADDARSLLRGLYAVAEVHLTTALPRTLALCQHSDRRVAAAAQRTREVLATEIGEQGIRYLRERQERRPERSALFELAGDAATRRQVLRWLARDASATRPGVADALRSGLEDRDWEVRVTAMLTAARLRVREVAREVRRIRLPTSVRSGLDRDEIRLLEVLRRLCYGLLQGRLKEASPDDAGPDPALLDHLRRAIVGQSVDEHDRAFLFVLSFLEPVKDAAYRPAAPEGLVDDGETFRLAVSGHEAIWVPSQPYWLGDDVPGDSVPEDSNQEGGLDVLNPVRVAEPEDGFFLLRDPEALGGPCTFEEARRRVAEFAEVEKVPARLPTADEWEMALRGPDARLYPWGNGFEDESEVLVESALGFIVLRPGPGEWTLDGVDAGAQPIVCAGHRPPRCPRRRRPADSDETHLVRPFLCWERSE